MIEAIYSLPVIAKLKMMGVNQAGAASIALMLYEERAASTDIIEGQTFEDWCRYKLEEAPYDEFE